MMRKGRSPQPWGMREERNVETKRVTSYFDEFLSSEQKEQCLQKLQNVRVPRFT